MDDSRRCAAGYSRGVLHQLVGKLADEALATKDYGVPADNIVMQNRNLNTIGDTIRIRRPPRVFTNETGRTVWMSDVEPVELELELDSFASDDPYDSCGAIAG